MMVTEADYMSLFSSSSLLASRRCLLWQSRPCWFLFMAYFVLCFPIAMKSRLCLDDVRVTRQPDGCIFYGDFGSSVYDRQSFEGYHGPWDVCPSSRSLFFQSSLVGFLPEKDDGQVPSLRVSKGSSQAAINAASKIANGKAVSCSLRNSPSGVNLPQGFDNRNMAVESVDFCEHSVVSDSCIKCSGAPKSDLDEHLEEAEAGILTDSSSLPEIEISPTTLDWGTKNIFSPSLAILKVTNKHNESTLNVYDLYSTNTQFSAYCFQKLSVAPGESASIPFLFLPRWLGPSFAQLVFQTSFGGFIVHAEGMATMSPYQLQPFVGFNISTGKRLSWNLSLYNPSADILYVKEVSTWISISSSKKKQYSAHVSCNIDRFQKYYVHTDSPVDGEWFSLKNGELGSSRVDFRPHQQWEVPPHSSKTILELNLWPYLAGDVSGTVSMKLGNSLEETETVILPIDVEVHERELYRNPSGSVSLHFDSLSPCHGNETIFSISLRNDASYLLNIVKINEETRSCKVFEIRYMEGLLLFPGTVTQIALISYNHPIDSKDEVIENHSAPLTCMLTIKTNDSVNSEMSFPCDDLVLSSCACQSASRNIETEGSYIKLVSKYKNEKCTSIRTSSLENSNELSPFKPKSSDLTESEDVLLDNWRSQATTSMMSVLEDQEVLFPVVQVGSHYSKWISVHNPSQKPIVMQLVLNSGAIVDHCKSIDDMAAYTFLTKTSLTDSSEVRVGFSIAEYAVTEAFVHPLESALFGPVIFRPSNRCMWRSSVLIRNNLSGVEWLPLQAFGGSQALVILEDSVPVHRLDFDLHVLKTSNVSSIEDSSFFCSNLFSKELYAKNIGEVPLEIMKLKVSGADCGSAGFSIHGGCTGFALAPGESRKLFISYQSDFSLTVVQRDLELSIGTGILVIPMKASVPVYILNMCRKASFRSMHWKLFLSSLLVSFVLLHLMLRIVPRFNQKLLQDARNSRPLREDEASFFHRCPESTNDCHDNAKKLGKACFDHHKNVSQLGNSLRVLVANNSQTLEMPENCNLTVRVGRGKPKRRKRRSNGVGLAAKFDVSSSQSGNSTPSSPLSPTISTPKQALAQSPNPRAEDQLKQPNNTKKCDFDVFHKERKAESAKCSSSSDHGPSLLTTKITGKPSLLLPSATFPGAGVGGSSFFASTSSIAPCARAPGSKLCKEQTGKGEGNDGIVKDFTYDIWGNHFSEKMFCRPKESMPMLSDDSEGNSYSFFTRDPPQSPMMMSVARSASASPGLETPS